MPCPPPPGTRCSHICQPFCVKGFSLQAPGTLPRGFFVCLFCWKVNGLGNSPQPIEERVWRINVSASSFQWKILRCFVSTISQRSPVEFTSTYRINCLIKALHVGWLPTHCPLHWWCFSGSLSKQKTNSILPSGSACRGIQLKTGVKTPAFSSRQHCVPQAFPSACYLALGNGSCSGSRLPSVISFTPTTFL